MDAPLPGSTNSPLGEKLSRHDSKRNASRHRARSDRRMRRLRTIFTILFLAVTLMGSMVLLAKGCQRAEPASGATASGD